MNVLYGQSLLNNTDGTTLSPNGEGNDHRISLQHGAHSIQGARESKTFVGSAQNETGALYFMGTFLRNQPGWDGSTSMDAPDDFAHFLLRRYEKDELSFLDEIQGTYGIALLDYTRERLLLVTDHSGIHKWFIHQTDEVLTFSSKLILMKDLLGSLTLDRGYEDFLLGYEFTPFGQTVFQGIRVLSAGKALIIEPDGIREHGITKPTRFQPEWSRDEMRGKTEAELKEKLYEVLLSSLQDQVTDASETAVVLGGFDSSLIAAMLARLGKKVDTFTFRFSADNFTQPYTDMLSQVVGNTHHFVDITPEVIREGIAQFSEHFNQIASQPHYLIQTRYLCQVMAEKGFNQGLTGDGCDGAFLGYPTVHRRFRLISRLSGIPKPLLKLAGWLLHWNFLENRLGHPYRLAHNVLAILMRPMPARGHIAHRVLGPESLNHLRVEAGPAAYRDAEAILAELAQGLENVPPVRLAYLGKGKVGLNKSKMDGSQSIAGVTLQSPFMHPALGAFARSMPEEFLRPGEKQGNFGKYILMKMSEEKGLLPPEIIYQKKRSPVGSPVDHWYMSELQGFVQQELKHLPFSINPTFLKHLTRKKWAEEWFRKGVAIDHLAFHALAMLLTYAQFTKHTS